jgi:hypothetical protein
VQEKLLFLFVDLFICVSKVEKGSIKAEVIHMVNKLEGNCLVNCTN